MLTDAVSSRGVAANFDVPPAVTDRPVRDRTAANPLDSAIEAVAQATSPLAQGEALRTLDGLTGDRATSNLLAQSGPDRGDDVRGTGRGNGGVRPTIGDGAATPAGITPGAGVPGFPAPPAAPATGDGSGAHGSRAATLGDRAFEQVAYRVADAADAIGLNNAARNMRHYLGNSGDVLQIDPARLAADIPAIGADMTSTWNSQVRDQALAHVRANYDGQPMQFQITSQWNGAYATKDASQDWFYAVGGFSYAHTANVTVTPRADGGATVRIEGQTHVFDRYNWDGGKAVTIGPMTVRDEQLGALHDAGLAREFEIRGSSNAPSGTYVIPRSQLQP